jgi:hypothetical protein
MGDLITAPSPKPSFHREWLSPDEVLELASINRKIQDLAALQAMPGVTGREFASVHQQLLDALHRVDELEHGCRASRYRKGHHHGCEATHHHRHHQYGHPHELGFRDRRGFLETRAEHHRHTRK